MDSMKSTTQQLYDRALDLDERDRANLAALLIESLEEEQEPGVEEAWREEIERRMAELDAGSVETIPWEEVRTRLWQLEAGHGG